MADHVERVHRFWLYTTFDLLPKTIEFMSISPSLLLSFLFDVLQQYLGDENRASSLATTPAVIVTNEDSDVPVAGGSLRRVHFRDSEPPAHSTPRSANAFPLQYV
jgi:hypothetical protein